MPLTGKKVAILVAEGVEDLEYYVPSMRLREERADVLTAGLDLTTVKGKHGLEITPTVKADQLKAADLHALLIPGGWAPDKLRRYPAVTNLVKEMNAANKIIGIICHGGLVAISAGIVKGRSVTGSLGIKDDLVNAGATWVDSPAFRDGNQIWGRVVADIPDFCRELVAALVETATQTGATNHVPQHSPALQL
ncbi:MAG TPA: type 1 glutamine amidotransferase domain-containing protein [Gemmatimonadaceae bacterium]